TIGFNEGKEDEPRHKSAAVCCAAPPLPLPDKPSLNAPVRLFAVGLGSPRARLMPQGFRRCFAYTSICDGLAFLSLPRSSRSVLSSRTSPLSLSPLRSSNQDFFPESSPRLDPKTAISQEIGEQTPDLRSPLPNFQRWAPKFPAKPNSRTFFSAANRSFSQ